MATTVGGWNNNLRKSCGTVVAEGKGSRGGEKVQKQPRERIAEQELEI